jgi:hypothetical protein
MTTEHDEQAALFTWSSWMEPQYPMLALLYAIPNGANKSIAAAMKFKAEGLKSGAPDVCLPWPNGIYHGLYIEMKVKGGKVSEKQMWWIAILKKAGYAAYVCWSFEEAKSIVCKYLGIEEA